MDTPQKTVTIVVPCFNRWPHVCDAIDSVINQSWPKTQCLVVDDASTDGTPDKIIKKYENNTRVTVLKLDTNKGQSFARNAGARSTSAEYIGFLDSDDLLIDTAIESRMKKAQENPNFTGIIFGDKIDETTHESLIPKKDLQKEKLHLVMYLADFSWLHTNSFLIQKSEFLSLQGFNEKLRKKEDIEFFIRALHRQPAIYAPGPCCVVRAIDSQRARNDHARIVEQGERFLESIESNPELMSSLHKHEIQKLTASDTSSVLHSLYRLKRGKQYRKTLLKAIKQGKIKPKTRLLKRYLLSLRHS